MSATKQNVSDYRDSAVFWFVRLEKSHEGADHEEAARAIRELRRLGVDIKFKPKAGGSVRG
jgi:hypothetical protein